jgi:hypothetical protein
MMMSLAAYFYSLNYNKFIRQRNTTKQMKNQNHHLQITNKIFNGMKKKNMMMYSKKKK